MSFFEKFFKFIKQDDGSYSTYNDHLGGGAYGDYRHFLWILLTIFACVLVYKIARKYKKTGNIIALVISILLLVTRTCIQTYRGFAGIEQPGWRAIPFHFCTVLTFLLPLTVICKWKKIYLPVCVLSMMGGIITILIGDYFSSKFMCFWTLEGIIAHSNLLIISFALMGADEFRINYKKGYQIIIGMGIMIAWASLANYVFFRNTDCNYMYLKRNALPGNFGGNLFILVYGIVFAILYIIIFFVPEIYRKVIKKHESRSI